PVEVFAPGSPSDTDGLDLASRSPPTSRIGPVGVDAADSAGGPTATAGARRLKRPGSHRQSSEDRTSDRRTRAFPVGDGGRRPGRSGSSSDSIRVVRPESSPPSSPSTNRRRWVASSDRPWLTSAESTDKTSYLSL